MSSLYIVIPSYNESLNIERVINDWYPIAEKCGTDSRLVIFDGTSPDGTADIITELQKTRPLLELKVYPKCGHGPTLEIAYKYALSKKADYIFQTDADGQTDPSEFIPFWEARDKYDVQIGFRKGRKDGFSRVVVTKTLRLILFFSFGMWITDANSPFRLMSRAALERSLLKIPAAHNLINVLLTVSFQKQKERMRYVPITFRPRQGGENTISLKQIVKIGLKSVKEFISLRGSL